MHTGPVSPQLAQGLTCSPQLPLPLQQYIQFILLFPVDVSSDKTRLFEISFPLSCLCRSLSAQGQMQGIGAPGGCQRESYSWKALSHSCSCSHDLRKGGEGGRVHGHGCTVQEGHAVQSVLKTYKDWQLLQCCAENCFQLNSKAAHNFWSVLTQ